MQQLAVVERVAYRVASSNVFFMRQWRAHYVNVYILHYTARTREDRGLTSAAVYKNSLPLHFRNFLLYTRPDPLPVQHIIARWILTCLVAQVLTRWTPA